MKNEKVRNMDDILKIIKQYDVNLQQFEFIKSDTSYKQGNKIYYEKVCDGLTLAANKELTNLDIGLSKRGMMIDFSRGKVYTVETVKKFIVKSACMGMNYLTMYIEDLIMLPNYPQYGYMRGRFSDLEINQIVTFAKKFDMLVIPAFQTLGHLEHFLRWQTSDSIKATDLTLDPLKPKTYEFIDELIYRMTQLFGTECFNIGLDEAFDLGFNRLNSTKIDQKQLFLDHLKKVVAICKKYKVKKIKMWSDMLFSIYSNTGGEGLYSTNFKNEVEKIDSDIELIYWNYWTAEADSYEKIIKAHYNFNNNVSFAGSVHTSKNLFYEYNRLNVTKAAIEACTKTNVEDILFTMWSEDGTNVIFETTYFGMYVTMCELFKVDHNSEDFMNISQMNYDHLLQICSIKTIGLDPISMLWSDPVLDVYFKSVTLEEIERTYNNLKALNKLEASTQLNIYYNNLIEYLQLDIKRYLTNECTTNDYQKLIELYTQILKHLENMWISDGKLHGIEELQKRLCTKVARYKLLKENPNLTHQIGDETLVSPIAPRYVRLYGPNRWRF